MTDPAKQLSPALLTRRAMMRCAALGVAALLQERALLAAPPVFSSSRLTVTMRGKRGPGGQDVLLIPGLASGPAIWSALLARLEGHRFHLVHIAGFADKPPGANAKGPLLVPLVSELARYLSEQAVPSPALIGHSMGGTLAMMLGLRGDIRANRIMVVDMLPDAAGMLGGTSSGLGYLADQLNGYFTGTKAGRQLLAEMVRSTPGSRDSDPDVIAQALTELARTDLTAKLALLKCPLNVVYALAAGTQAAAAQARRYKSAYASTRTLSLTGIGPSGHMVPLDQPDKFAREVRAFLA